MSQVKKILKETPRTHGRTCLKCGKKVLLSGYYANALNKEWQFKDKWCKNCVKKYIKDLDTLKDYCHFNNRAFSPSLYVNSELLAEGQLCTDTQYQGIIDLDKSKTYRFEKVLSNYFKQMNMTQYYTYEDNNFDSEKTIRTMEQVIHDKNVAAYEDGMDDVREWSSVWNGNFTKKDIEFLDNYYAKAEKQFGIDDIQQEYTVREVAKTALDINKNGNKMRAGDDLAAAKKYQDSINLFTKLSENAKLSANKRGAGDKIGTGDLSSLIKKLETSGALIRQVRFPKDDVDKTSDDLRHVLRSFEGEDLQKGKE